jgi:membrane protease YdiL (CAAX protease family)
VQRPNYPPGPPTFGDSNPIHREELEADFQPPRVDPDNPSWGLGAALLVWLASIILMFVVPVIFLIPYAAAVGFRSFDPLGKTAILLQVFSLFPTHLLTFGLVWIVVTRFGKIPFRDAIGWGWAGRFRLWSCILLGIGLFVVGSFLAWLLGAGKPTQLEQIINSSLTARYMISFLAVCTAPFVEEFVYRGVLYAPLQRLAGVPGAVLIVLALFTIIHVPQYWPNAGVIAAVGLLSVVLTVVRAYSGRLLPCIVIHLVFNGVQALILIIEPHVKPMIPSAEQAAPALSFLLPLIDSLTTWIAKSL